MLHSMTGFGRSQQVFDEQTITIEIKSINSKNFDLRVRLPAHYQSKEMELRRLLNNHLIRGKVDFHLSVASNDQTDYKIDNHAFESYYNQLLEMSNNLGIDKGDLLYTVTRLPGVVVQHENELNDTEWARIIAVSKQAIEQLNGFRAKEGLAMQKDMSKRINIIQSSLEQIAPFEAERIERVRQRLQNNLDQFIANNKIDENRFEQELLYYLDKLDIAEEKTRLKQHCSYFLEIIGDEKVTRDKGKKLNFVLQEIGREINTLGAKANYAEIQKIVVRMKDEADKVKEQLANIL